MSDFQAIGNLVKCVIFLIAILPLVTPHSGSWRLERGAPAPPKNQTSNTTNQNPPKQNSSASSDVTPIISNHLKLARVFNALYLQMQLSEGKIKENDVIAGIWNMKDRTVLEKLIGFDVSGPQRGLKDVDIQLEKIQSVPNTIVDVNGLQADLNSLQEIPEDSLGKIRTAATQNFEAPRLLHLSSLGQLDRDSVKLNLNLMAKAENGTQLKIQECSAFVTRIGNLQLTDLFFKEMDDFVNTKANSASLTVILEGITPMKNVYKKATDLDEFLKKIKVAQSKLQILKPLVNALPKPEAMNNLKTIRSSIEDCLVHPTDIPIGSAFIPNHDVSKVYEDLKSDWFKSIFGGNGNLTMFSTILDEFKPFTNGYKAVDNSLRDILLGNGQEEVFELISKFVDSVKTMENVSTHLSSTNNQFCSNFPSQSEPQEANEVEDFASRLSDSILAFETVRDVIKGIRESGSLDEKIAVSQKLGLDCMKISNLSEWVISQEFKDTKAFLESIDPHVDELIIDQSHYVTLTDLETISTKIDKVQTWMKASMLADNTCEWPRTLNLDPVRDLDKKVAVIDQVKKNNTLKTADALFKSISSLKTQVQGLSSTPSNNNAPTKTGPSSSTPSPKGTPAPRGKRDAKSSSLNIDRQKLLDFSFAVYSFSQMEKLRSMDKDFDVIYKEEQQTLAAIKVIRNTQTYQKVDGVWKNYTNFKKDLETLRTQNKEALGKVKSEKEKNLRDVGKVYESLASSGFPKKVDIGPYKDTLKLMDNQPPNIGKSLNSLSDPVSMNWDLVHANYRKIPKHLDQILKDLEKLFTPEEPEALEDGQEDGGNIPWYYYLIGGVGLVVLILAIVGIAFFVMKKSKKTREVKSEYDEPDYTPPEDDKDFEFNYMQLQDARLKMNKRDKVNNTPIYSAVMFRDWDKVNDYLDKGALIDAPCGEKNRTVLFELVLMKDQRELVTRALKHGAYLYQHDDDGNTPDTWSNHQNYGDLFQKYHNILRSEHPIRRAIPPNTPRPWNVLVMDKNCVSRAIKNNLPARIGKVTWGYKKGMKVNEFSHVVLPKKRVENHDTLKLDDEDPIYFKLIGSMGCLMDPTWLEALANKETAVKAMDEDFRWYILHTSFGDHKNEKAIFQCKTEMHKGIWPLLHNVDITLCETKDKKYQKNMEEWKEVIELYGAKLVEKPVPDRPKIVLPYHTCDDKWRDIHHSQNRCWLLTFPDVTEDYLKANFPHLEKDEQENYAQTSFRFLLECIARHTILGTYNDVVRIDYVPVSEIELVKSNMKPVKKLRNTKASVETVNRDSKSTTSAPSMQTKK